MDPGPTHDGTMNRRDAYDLNPNILTETTTMKPTHSKSGLQLVMALALVVACLVGFAPDPATAGVALIAIGNVAPFPVDPQLTAVSIGYRNEDFIADEVLPRVGVNAQNFKYNVYPKGELLTPPETLVGRRGRPNTVEFTATETPGATDDHALDGEVPQNDIDNARAAGQPDPVMKNTEGTTQLLLAAREVRASALVFNDANFSNGHKVTLAGNDRWDVDHADSNPIDDILAALDACIMRPNVAVLGHKVGTKLRTHPKILKAYNGTLGDTGLVPLQFLAELFELKKVLVGKGWVNTAKKGQAVSVSRVWGPHAAFLHIDPTADANNGATFGFTAQWRARQAGSWADKDIGAFGGTRVRVAESVKELIMAGDLGYMIKNAVS
jgi:hypothetical protein